MSYSLKHEGQEIDKLLTDIDNFTSGDMELTDSQKETARKNISAGGSNPNLLDNPWFTVNQRGVSGLSNGYGFDRWFGDYFIDGNKLVITDYISQYVYQRFDEELKNSLNNKLITVSILYDDGTIESGSGIYKSSPSEWVVIKECGKCNIYIAPTSINEGGNLRLSPTANIGFKAVKLELGNVSTLANDVAPNDAIELVKCQRYLRAVDISGGTNTMFGVAIGASETLARCFIPLGEMRATPVLEVIGTNQFYLLGNNSYPTCKLNSVLSKTSNGVVVSASNYTTSFASNQLYTLSGFPSVTTKLLFKSEL